MVTNPIAQNSGIKKNFFEQALDKAKSVISQERKDSPQEAQKVEPATTQIKTQVKAEKPDAYIQKDQATKAASTNPADTNTVKALWDKAVNIIKEDVVKPIEKTAKKITGYDNANKPQTEEVKLKLGNTSTVKNSNGEDVTINELASDEQIKQVRAEVTRNTNTILNSSSRNGEQVEVKERSYEEIQKGLKAEAKIAQQQQKPIYESNIDLSNDNAEVKKRNEETKQAWANLEQNRQLLSEYRKSLKEDKDELADITAREAEIDQQLAEIEELQKNLRETVGSTITLTNGAKLTNDGVEDNGIGIKQLSADELKAKGINPDSLGKDNAFIEFETTVKDANGEPVTDSNGNPKTLTQQHLVNSSVKDNKRVTNITTDAQDLNNDGKINEEELPSKENKPLEKVLSNFTSGSTNEIHLTSVEFSGDKVVIPPSARGSVGEEYKAVYGKIPEGTFKSLKLNKGDAGMTVETKEANDFWDFYKTNNTSLTNLITGNFQPEISSEDNEYDQNHLNIGKECIKTTKKQFKFNNGTEGEAYTLTLNQNQYENLINTTATNYVGIDAGRDAKWLNDAYSDTSLSVKSEKQEKTFGNHDLVIKRRDPNGNFTYELILSPEAFTRFQARLNEI